MSVVEIRHFHRVGDRAHAAAGVGGRDVLAVLRPDLGTAGSDGGSDDRSGRVAVVLIDERFFRLRSLALGLVAEARRGELVVPDELEPFVDEWIANGTVAAADRADLLGLAETLYGETLWVPACAL